MFVCRAQKSKGLKPIKGLEPFIPLYNNPNLMSRMSPNHCEQGSEDNDERNENGIYNIDVDSVFVRGFADMHE